jgi:HK97 family phage major capsid protein
VILTSDGSFNQARNHFRQVVATGNQWDGVSTTEASWSVDAEAAEVSDDATTFANPTVDLYKISGFIPISIEALQDEANVTNEIGRILAMGKDTLESQLFMTGTGSSQHTGVITGVDAVTASRVASTTADTFGLEDVYLMDQALPARYRARAGWFAHRYTHNLIRQFDTAGGAGLWADNLREGVPSTLLSRPAYEAEAMASTITAAADNLLLLYAESESFVIADRVGMTVEPIQHLVGSNQRPTGQRGFYAYARSGSNVVNAGGARILRV